VLVSLISAWQRLPASLVGVMPAMSGVDMEVAPSTEGAPARVQAAESRDLAPGSADSLKP